MARHFEGKEFNCKECGKLFKRSQSQIKQGRVHYCSLACSGKARSGVNNPAYKHGKAKRGKHTAEYRTWLAMISRCYHKGNSAYPRYGGAGIKVAEEWLNDFNQFYLDMGEKPTKNHSIDRIDGTKNYSKDNCRWATNEEQTNNQKSNVKVMWENEEYNVSQLMKKLGIFTKSGVYYSRLKRGWSATKAFTTPVGK